uniref:G domain-containing protein n=1 Tax=Rhabditophanes sp. KR3021 TaxID=114890 RepID=A0AC35TT19_9BILA
MRLIVSIARNFSTYKPSGVPKSFFENTPSRFKYPAKEEETKVLKIAIIGAPNVGKSLLTNQLVQAEVAAVSKRMDTTKRNLTAFFTEKNVQLMVVDSPGLVGIQHASKVASDENSYILTDPERALSKAEYILVVQDCTHTGDYIHHRILHLLNRYNHIPASLVLNKVDLINQRPQLLPLVKILTNNQVDKKKITSKRVNFGKLGKIDEKKVVDESRDGLPLYVNNNCEYDNMDEEWKDNLKKVVAKPLHKCSWSETKHLFSQIRGWSHFKSVFFVSSLTSEGIDSLRTHLTDQALVGEFVSTSSTVTTKNPKDICLDQIKAECLNRLPSEVGYGINLKIMDWSFDNDNLNIIVEIHCSKKRWPKLVIGKDGQNIVEMERSVNNIIQNLMNQPLNIQLLVRYNGQTVTLHNLDQIN